MLHINISIHMMKYYGYMNNACVMKQQYISQYSGNDI